MDGCFKAHFERVAVKGIGEQMADAAQSAGIGLKDGSVRIRALAIVRDSKQKAGQLPVGGPCKEDQLALQKRNVGHVEAEKGFPRNRLVERIAGEPFDREIINLAKEVLWPVAIPVDNFNAVTSFRTIANGIHGGGPHRHVTADRLEPSRFQNCNIMLAADRFHQERGRTVALGHGPISMPGIAIHRANQCFEPICRQHGLGF